MGWSPQVLYSSDEQNQRTVLRNQILRYFIVGHRKSTEVQPRPNQSLCPAHFEHYRIAQ